MPCSSNNLSAVISTQGAAGSIYATLTVTNQGRTACQIILGNTVNALFDAKNMIVHYEKSVPNADYILEPTEKVYSQIHYPNGPQCQSAIIDKPITFIYKTDDSTLSFKSDSPQALQLIVQDCQSPTQITTIDIWPLSKSPITP